MFFLRKKSLLFFSLSARIAVFIAYSGFYTLKNTLDEGRSWGRQVENICSSIDYLSGGFTRHLHVNTSTSVFHSSSLSVTRSVQDTLQKQKHYLQRYFRFDNFTAGIDRKTLRNQEKWKRTCETFDTSKMYLQFIWNVVSDGNG